MAVRAVLGLYPLETHHVAELTWGSTGVGDLSKPFPHTGPWNLPKEFWHRNPILMRQRPWRKRTG